VSAECRSCGAPILWAETTNGKLMPLDAEPTGKGLVIERSGISKANADAVVFSRDVYVSHFATCPNAAQHRKTREAEHPTGEKETA
jgi:hypothetical protein